MHKWVLSNPEAFTSVFDQQVAPFFENTLFACDKIFAQTKDMLRFYKRYLRQRQADNVLLVCLECSDTLSETEKLKLLKTINS